jgi:hypothetical protein
MTNAHMEQYERSGNIHVSWGVKYRDISKFGSSAECGYPRLYFLTRAAQQSLLATSRGTRICTPTTPTHMTARESLTWRQHASQSCAPHVRGRVVTDVLFRRIYFLCK